MVVGTASNLFRPYEIITNIIPGAIFLLSVIPFLPFVRINQLFTVSVPTLLIIGLATYLAGLLLRILSNSISLFMLLDRPEGAIDFYLPDMIERDLPIITHNEFGIPEKPSMIKLGDIPIIVNLIESRIEANLTTKSLRLKMLFEFLRVVGISLWVVGSIYLVHTLLVNNSFYRLDFNVLPDLPIYLNLIGMSCLLIGYGFNILSHKYRRSYQQSLLIEFYSEHSDELQNQNYRLDSFKD